MKLGENGKKAKDVAYVCIYTTGEEIEWRDEIDRTLGRFTYWGDNRKAGNPMTKTKFGGNLFLQNIFAKLAVGQRKQIAPVFIFQKYCGRDVVFCGLAVPGDRRMNSQDALVGNVKKCAVGKHPKSEKHGNTAQFSEVERSGTQENCGGIESGCRLRLRPLPVLRRRQSQRVARIDPNAVVVDKNIAENDRFDLFSR